jgi:hypothetical protein
MKNVSSIRINEKEDLGKMNCTMSPIRKDFLASNLRSQLGRLNSILNNIEEDGDIDAKVASGSLKEVELNLRQIRKLCVEG